jgi:transposase
MEPMTQEQYDELKAAAAALDEYAETVADRDNRIRRAHRAGMSNVEIAKRAKVGRTTIIAVLAAENSNSKEA